MVWTGYFYSDRVAIAVARSRPASRQYPRLHHLVEGCARCQAPEAEIVVDDPAPNARATGRNPEHAAIAVTTGLLAIMNRDELEGVLAHELSHIHNYDILVGTIAVTLVGFVALLADFGLRLLLFGGIAGRRRDSRDAGQVYLLALSVVFIVLAPIAARRAARHLPAPQALADVSGVLITRNPAGLIAALELRDRPSVAHAPAATAPLDQCPWTTAPPARARLVQPAVRDAPPIEQRIAALREIEGAGPLLPSA
jgi:heat shock protein HtpX